MRCVGCAGAKNARFSAREAILWIPDRTASKWKHGRGLPELARLLGAEAEELLRGDLRKNPPPGGNMKILKRYFCPHCGAAYFRYISTSTACTIFVIPRLSIPAS